MFVLPLATAANFEPSADEAIEYQPNLGACVGRIQVAPAFVEVKIKLADRSAATNFVPSAEEATDCQPVTGALFDIQVAPVSVEVYIEPSMLPPAPPSAAIILLPSAEQATDCQVPRGALVARVQTAPEFVEI